jgi:hypothetical protein
MKRKKSFRMGCVSLLVLVGLGGLVSFFNDDQPAAIRSTAIDLNQAAQEVSATFTNTPAPAPLATATEPPTPLPSVPTDTHAATGPVAAAISNLRAGPGPEHAIIGSAQVGQALDLVGQLADGSWYQLRSGEWIAAELVTNAPPGLSIVQPPAPPIAAPVVTVQPAPQPAQNNPNAFVCTGGCAVAPDPSCAIKGNVNSKGDRIYHVPGWRDYDRTTIKPEEGDRWFCTDQEARDAGFREPLNH